MNSNTLEFIPWKVFAVLIVFVALAALGLSIAAFVKKGKEKYTDPTGKKGNGFPPQDDYDIINPLCDGKQCSTWKVGSNFTSPSSSQCTTDGQILTGKFSNCDPTVNYLLCNYMRNGEKDNLVLIDNDGDCSNANACPTDVQFTCYNPLDCPNPPCPPPAWALPPFPPPPEQPALF